jgi:CheY-like chemotaxis protein
MRTFAAGRNTGEHSRHLDLARVLLVQGELAPRLALQTILQAGGYSVDVAATPAEALSMMDADQYDLVLSDSRFGARKAGPSVLAYARVKDYSPATAFITNYEPALRRLSSRGRHEVAIHTENLPSLLGKVAELIGLRASRRYRPLRTAV